MIISKKIKMSELVETNYHLLGILSRLGVKGSFSDHTVEDICSRYGLDADTFLLICSVYSGREAKPTEEQLRRCRLQDLLLYLHSSHEYYLNSALAKLSPSIEEMIRPTQPVRQRVFRQFFEDYRNELEKHFAYEENTVIPYIRRLMDGNAPSGYSISKFREAHSNIEESLSDLKNLIMQSLPPECDGEPRIEVLSNIFHLQEDLRHHTYIEDDILVPLVELYERKGPSVAGKSRYEEDDAENNELSDREKEVLVQVARGLLNKEIADKLCISVNTVITHRKNITRKIGIKTTPGLTVYAILNGLVDINSIE
jgi:regulator of cell morphogenesis and NO signaling